MALQFRAATTQRFFGTLYNAGDVIVTTGLTGAQLHSLVRHEAVYVLDTAGPVVTTPDGLHTYRIGVSNAGAVTATQLS